MKLIGSSLSGKTPCRILDIGGEPDYWRALRDVWSGYDLDITIVNLTPPRDVDGEFTVIAADARDLRDFASNSFDAVHSNSVIEHVGGWPDQRRMAAEVARLAPVYHVQTPNFWFPVEVHMRTPLMHWLPQPLQRRIVMARQCGFYPRAATVAEAEHTLSDVRLLDFGAMQALFPDARIQRERAGPFTKSLIATRGPA